jgi:hypothetical protein
MPRLDVFGSGEVIPAFHMSAFGYTLPDTGGAIRRRLWGAVYPLSDGALFIGRRCV